jgi:hypothetical protein
MRDDETRAKGVTTGTAALEHEIHDSNPDPVTGEPGAHPVGTGVGAATGGTVGAVIGGAVGGPLGAMVGAAVGGVAGGLAGKGISESVNPTEEDAFWRDHYSTRPYASGRTYDQLQPAYRHGWEARTRYEDRSWNDVETDLERDWTQRHGSTGLAWNDAKNATRDAWDRITDRFSDNLRSDVGNTTGYESTSFTGAANTPAGSVSSGMTAVGHGATEGLGWSSEDSYWRNNYSSRPYAAGRTYDDLSPAYRYGYDSANQYRGRSWNEVENDLERGWEKAKGATRSTWLEVKDAVRDAWHRVERATPGDADRDGR